MAWFAEMRRRNVLKVALLYAVLSWLIVWFVGAIQADVVLPAWTETFMYFVVGIGFPVALWFAWTYEITPTGLRKAADVDQTQSIVYKTGQKLNAAVAVLFVLGVLAVFGQRLLPKFEFLAPLIPEGRAPLSESTPAEIRTHTLDNGLKIIVWPDRDIPNVAMYNFVRAGSRNEYPGITGLSHFFEHLMFGATAGRDKGEFLRLIEQAGGRVNAYTTSDVTVFMDLFPKAALQSVFALEADRFENLVVEQEALDTEREVVYSERRTRVDNDNAMTLREQVRATAFVAHPYQFSGIGWPSDIEAWTVRSAERFYDTFYAPNNRTIVIVGDVTPRNVFSLADIYFAPLPPRAAPPRVTTVEPKQLGARRVTVKAPAQTPLLHIAFHSSRARAPATLRLRLLLNILIGGESSRLHRALVENERIALSVDGTQDQGFDPGLTYFSLTLRSGGDAALVERRVVEELRRVADDGVTEAELEKARNIMLAEFWRGLATIRGKAGALGEYEVFYGNYEALFELPARLAAITVEDLQSAAAGVFSEDNMTVGVLLPADQGGGS